MKTMEFNTPYSEYKNVGIFKNEYVNGGYELELWNEEGPIATLTKWVDSPLCKEKNEMYIDTNNCPFAMELIERYKLGTPTGKETRVGRCLYPLVVFDMEEVDKYLFE